MLALFATPSLAQGLRDPFFSKVPFERWQSERKHRDIRWDVEIFPVELSVHQRLLARIRVEIDADYVVGGSAAVLLVEYRDAAGTPWQTHVTPPDYIAMNTTAPHEFVLFANAFVLPGEYTVSIAVCNTVNLEHSFLRRTIRAKAPGNDPLPLAWRGLPEVEFLPAVTEPPDDWFLPSIETRMPLPLATRRKVNLDVLLNATPGGNGAGSASAMARNMSVLIPSLKVISQIELPNGSVNVRLLDLTRRRVAFDQENVQRLDWPRLRGFFNDTHPGIIDARALAGFWKMRNFFWDQITGRRATADSATARVVLVLSGPAFYPNQESLPAVDETPADCAFIFHVRYRPSAFFPRAPRPRAGAHPLPPRALMRPLAEDDLQIAVRKLNGRVFDVASPWEFRRVLAAIMEQISTL